MTRIAVRAPDGDATLLRWLYRYRGEEAWQVGGLEKALRPGVVELRCEWTCEAGGTQLTHYAVPIPSDFEGFDGLEVGPQLVATADPGRSCVTCEFSEHNRCVLSMWEQAGIKRPASTNDLVCDHWTFRSLRVGSIDTYYGNLLLSKHADNKDGIERWQWGIESYMGVSNWQPIPDYLSEALLRFRAECPPPEGESSDD